MGRCPDVKGIAALLPQPFLGDMALLEEQGATVMETVAAREIRRYVYLRTGLLVPIVEAQACGTAVIAPDWGCFPEVVRDGETGFICRTNADWRAAVERAGGIEPAACQAWANERFSLEAAWPKYRYIANFRPFGEASVN